MGGQDSGGAIYNPQYTGGLEQVLTQQGLAALAQKNPSAIQALMGTSQGASMMNSLGFGGQQATASSTPQTNAISNTPSGVTISNILNPSWKNPYGQSSSSSVQSSGQSPSSIASIAPQTQPFGAQSTGNPKENGYSTPEAMYSDMANKILNGKTVTGGTIPQYQAPKDFTFTQPNYNPTAYQGQGAYNQYQFTTPNISNIPQQAFGTAQNAANANINQQAQQGQQQATKAMASRGMGMGGVAQGGMTSLERGAQEQSAQVAAQMGLQQAQSQVGVAQTQGQWDQQRQQSQAAEQQYGYGQAAQQGQFGATLGEQQQQYGAGLNQWTQQSQAAQNLAQGQQSLSANQILNGINTQNIGALGTLQNQQSQSAMAPYQMLSQLYGQNIGINNPQTGGGKGDPFSSMLGAAGAAAGAVACLPEGTPIDLEGAGTIPVDVLVPGMKVKGGTVLQTSKSLRPEGHKFYIHKFDSGNVTMSMGHPFFDQLKWREPSDIESQFTHDIRTSEGFYYVNGVKLGSTLDKGAL